MVDPLQSAVVIVLLMLTPCMLVMAWALATKD